ncbi:hypothetical protein ACIU1J_05420 [Azospirillum doebereinerae]|uniref:hypothetical protein n=1 Tax=Azospirillum doebereinerae TaxID=92933 RepID=UPI001EE55BA6|nr:hypothetical protein [Azospirillum doebereinerae]MCG5240856.1 hypothetical protein [Azospirillum doebereinerae]
MSKPKPKRMPPLSFMKDVPDGKRKTRRIFWAVEASDYLDDNERGFQYAAELFAHMEETGYSFLVNFIIRDMIAAGRFGGVEIEFIERIGQYAKLGYQVATPCARREGEA